MKRTEPSDRAIELSETRPTADAMPKDRDTRTPETTSDLWRALKDASVVIEDAPADLEPAKPAREAAYNPYDIRPRDTQRKPK
jgi:hypothetical protein